MVNIKLIKKSKIKNKMKSKVKYFIIENNIIQNIYKK